MMCSTGTMSSGYWHDKMLKKLLYILILLLLTYSVISLTGCSTEERPGFDQAINPIWEYHYGVGLSTGIRPILHENKVLYASKSVETEDLSANDQLIALNKTDGDLLWKWNDHFEDTQQIFDANSLKPVAEGIVAITTGSRNFGIDLGSGQTVWKNRNPASTSSSDLSLVGNDIFRTDIADPGAGSSLFTEKLMRAPINSGQWHEVFKVEGGDTLRQGLQVPTHYVNEAGDIVLIFTNTQLSTSNNLISPRLISYNLSRSEINYDVLLESPSQNNAVDWFPLIDDDRIYLAVDDLLICLNLYSGEPIWQLQLNANLLFSGFILVDNQLFAKSEGDGYLWSVNKYTGEVNWKKPSTGISSSLSYYNDILYFVGDMKLQIVDATNGETLAEIYAPSSWENPNDNFNDFCTVDPATGKIYLASLSRAYCYPPYQP